MLSGLGIVALGIFFECSSAFHVKDCAPADYCVFFNYEEYPSIMSTLGLKGSTFGKFTNITVSGCNETMDFCPLKKGQNASMQFQFTTNEEVVEVHAIVHGIIGGIPVPFGLPHPDGCTDSGLTCPLAPGSLNTYLTQLPVRTSYPRMKLTVKWELQNEKNKDIICFELPVKIV